jgi:hypothetical protein
MKTKIVTLHRKLQRRVCPEPENKGHEKKQAQCFGVPKGGKTTQNDKNSK